MAVIERPIEPQQSAATVIRSVRRREPGLLERMLIIALIFFNQFGTPNQWTSPSSLESNPLLVFGTLAAVAVLALGLVGNGEAVSKVLHSQLLLVVFVGWLFLSTVWSTAPTETLRAAVHIAVLTLFAVILVVRYEFSEILGLFAAAFVIGLLLDLVWVVALPSYGVAANGWTGLGSQKNALGTHASQALPLFVLLGRYSRRIRYRMYLAAVLALVLLVGSESKTALASVILTVVASAIYVGFRARRTLYGAVALTLLLTMTVATMFATANIGLLAETLDRDPTLTGRTKMWTVLMEQISEVPWLGFGYGGYWQGYLSPAHDVWVVGEWQPTHSHNALIEIAIQLGVVAALVFLLINLYAVVRATRYIQIMPGPLALVPLTYLTLFLMASITESGVVNQRVGWVMFCVMIWTVANPRVDTQSLAAETIPEPQDYQVPA